MVLPPDYVLRFKYGKRLEKISSIYAYPVGFHNLVREISGAKYIMNRLVDIQSVREE